MTALQGELLSMVRRDRARRTRREKFGSFLVEFIGTLLGNVLNALFGGWLFMLGVAVIHDHWWAAVPTIGYWWSALIVYLLRGVFSSARTKAKDGES